MFFNFLGPNSFFYNDLGAHYFVFGFVCFSVYVKVSGFAFQCYLLLGHLKF